MDWRAGSEAFVAALIGAMGGSAVAPKLLGDRWLEKVKAQYSKELAEIENKLSILLSDRQNSFLLGANSHMAMLLFDKHIGFCEEYVDAMSKALYVLIQHGKRDQPLDVRELFKIRQKWALWLTDEIEVDLDQFEHNVTRIFTDAPVLDEKGEHGSKEFSVRSLTAHLRKILAIEELTKLRNELVKDLVKKPPSVL
jgi:hypothetical protein